MVADPIQKCPICNEPLVNGQTECPRCGFKLIGKTQAFKPVSDEQAGQNAQDSPGTPALEILTGPYAGESFVLKKGSFTIGRDPKCDIFLSNMTVSRHHATITIEGNGARIVDAGSLNGTWVDGKVVDEAILVPGTRIQIGNFDMAFRYLKK
jgi:pSer/pThr/pTyr-binding forkhead associated (FHA) protein